MEAQKYFFYLKKAQEKKMLTPSNKIVFLPFD
jgi:hypothetical protein